MCFSARDCLTGLGSALCWTGLRCAVLCAVLCVLCYAMPGCVVLCCALRANMRIN